MTHYVSPDVSFRKKNYPQKGHCCENDLSNDLSLLRLNIYHSWCVVRHTNQRILVRNHHFTTRFVVLGIYRNILPACCVAVPFRSFKQSEQPPPLPVNHENHCAHDQSYKYTGNHGHQQRVASFARELSRLDTENVMVLKFRWRMTSENNWIQ